MDNYWNPYRLAAASSANTPLRYDQAALDQAGLSMSVSSGLGALTPQPIPAHPTRLPTSRLPSLGYSTPGVPQPPLGLHEGSAVHALHQSLTGHSTSSQPKEEPRYSPVVSAAPVSISRTQFPIAPGLIKEPTSEPSRPTSQSWNLQTPGALFNQSPGDQYREPPPAHSGSRISQSQHVGDYSRQPTRENPHQMSSQAKFPSFSSNQPQQQQVRSPATPSPIPCGNPSSTPSFDIPSPYASLTNLRSYAETVATQSASLQNRAANYDNISPAPTPAHTEQQQQSSFGTVSLQDLADISANREKLAMDAHSRSINNGQLQVHHQSTMQHAMLTNVSPAQHPMPSPSSAHGSPQVPISSPQSNMPVSNGAVHAPSPIQAVPDSTTKPKKARSKPRPKKRPISPPLVHEKVSPLIEKHHVQMQQALAMAEGNMPVYVGGGPGGNGYENHLSYGPTRFDSTVTDAPLSDFMPTPAMLMDPMLSHFQDHGVKDESVFMTNTSGSAFVNPNDHTFKEEIKEEVSDKTLEDNAGLSLSTLQNKGYSESKPVIIDDPEFHDEFGHLSSEPVEIKQENDRMQNRPLNPNSADNTSVSKANQQTVKAPGAKPSPFQSSFLSFLQGTKPETLSSVTNSSITKRPVMPKYFPEPARPRVPLPPPSDSDSDDDFKKTTSPNVIKTEGKSPSKPAGAQPSTSPDARVVRPPVTSARQPNPSQTAQKVPPLKISLSKVTATTPVAQKLSKMRKTSSGGRGRKKKNAGDLEEDVTPREKSTRKAKEKTEQKRKEKQTKKKKPRFEDDDFSDPEDFIALSSDEEKEYDSDKDPAWNPKLETQPDAMLASVYIPSGVASGSDDESRPGRKRKSSVKTPVRRRSDAAAGSAPIRSGPGPGPANTPLGPQPVVSTLEDSSDDESPAHYFQRGEFVVEKKELKNKESYPIWKLDAGRLLQKFEPVKTEDGLLHKTLSTYTSWSESVKKNYRAIKVKMMANIKGTETVEVLPEFRPKTFDTVLEEHVLMQPFNVYMQIMLSQALEEGFLSAITAENDDYYSGPMRRVEGIVDERKVELAQRLGWKPNFMENVEKFPFLNLFVRGSGTGSCEATGTEPEPEPEMAEWRIRLLGDAYDRNTLKDCAKLQVNTETFIEFNICRKVHDNILLYHKLHHYRYTLHRKCVTKVLGLKAEGKEMSDILDECLRDRIWIQCRFRSFQKWTVPLPETTSVDADTTSTT